MSERTASVRTPRLLLRCFSVDDAPALKAAVDENLAHLRPWMDWAATEPTPLAGVEERLARYARDFEEDADWVYAVLDAGGERLLGVVGVHLRPGPGEREIGYWLRAECEGMGYMTEAVAALTRAAFERHGARCVMIRCDPRNTRSIAVARRAGYVYERTQVDGPPAAGGESHARTIWLATRPPASTARAGGS